MEILTTPIKSAIDKKEYRLIRLENGLKVLLISDEDKNSLSAGSLCAFVGSYDNPPHVPGLAHFFEHMIFLDPGNYETNFMEFIQSHGGDCNAMTANDFTQYLFKISNDKFEEALVRFAEVFIAPNLNRNLMQNERLNVDSEFRLRKQSPSSRFFQILRLYLNQNHHASIFPTGNLQTLKDNITDDDLHAELVKFLDKYVANKMALCVQSSRPLDEMQKLVVDNFLAMKKNDDIKFNYELPVNFDELVRPEFYSKMLYIKDSNESSMVISWILPSVQHHYKSKPLQFIRRIIESDDEGGLVPYLKSKNLITYLNLSQENWLSSLQFTCFQLEVELTDNGMENIEEVLSVIYSYLLMIKETSRDDYRRLFNDVREDLDQRFDFLTEGSPWENVEIARKMNIFEDADVLKGQYVLFEYDEDVLMDYIQRITDGKFNITIMTKKGDNFNLHEDIYDVDYKEVDVPENLKSAWNDRKLNSEFFLEKPNPYRVTNFEIFTDNEKLDHPEKIFRNEIIEVWHILDRKFKKPMVHIEMVIMLKDFSRNSETFAYMKLFQKISTEIFDRKFSKSQRAGLSNDITVDFDHLNIAFKGYNDKMLMVIENTFIELKALLENIDEALFIRKCTEYKKNLSEYIQYPRNAGSEELKKILSNNYHSDFDVLNALKKINFEKFKVSIKEMFTQMKIITLVMGNMKKEDALKIPELFHKILPCEQLNEEHRVIGRGYQIPIGSHTIRMKSLSTEDDTSCILNYYHIGPYSIRTQNLTSMLELFLNPKAFDFLRTKSQLSYTVEMYHMKLEKMSGIILGVFSHEDLNDFIKVSRKMEEFVNILCPEFVAKITDEEFEALKKGRIALLSVPKVSLSQDFSTYFREIHDETYNFNRTIESIEDVKSINKDNFQKFFDSIFGTQHVRKLMIQIIGRKESERENKNSAEGITKKLLIEKTEIDEKVITDIKKFQKSLYIYPVNNN